MKRQKALEAYSYNEKVYLTKERKFSFDFKSDFDEKMFKKAIDLIVTIAIKSTNLNNNPLLNPKGEIASLLSKAVLESNLNEKEKVDLIYDLELNISNSKFKNITYYSEEKINFYKAAQLFNDKIKDIINEKEVKELRMLVNNSLREV